MSFKRERRKEYIIRTGAIGNADSRETHPPIRVDLFSSRFGDARSKGTRGKLITKENESPPASERDFIPRRENYVHEQRGRGSLMDEHGLRYALVPQMRETCPISAAETSRFPSSPIPSRNPGAVPGESSVFPESARISQELRSTSN